MGEVDAAGLVDDQDYGAVFFLALWFFGLHRKDRLNRRAAVASGGEAGRASKHQKAIALGYVVLDGGKIARRKSIALDVVKDYDTVASWRWQVVPGT